MSVDISAVKAAGDKLLTAAMLCTWSYGFGCVDAAAALADLGAGPRRSYLAVMDELWRALRGAPGLVEHADSLTRLNRAKGMASIMITHSLADLDALATPEDRAKARGFMDRSAITVLAGLPPRELARVAEITPLTGPERALVASWSAPESYLPGARHPGRGKYLIKTGERLGIPVQLTLVGPEQHLYETDPQFVPSSEWPAGNCRGWCAVSRALGPRPSLAPGGTAGCWAVLAACWGLVALNGIVWAAARIAAGLSGGTAEPFGIKFAADVLHGRTSTAWPHTPTPAVTAVAAVLLALAVTVVVLTGRAVARHGRSPVTRSPPWPVTPPWRHSPGSRPPARRRSFAGPWPARTRAGLDPGKMGLALGPAAAPRAPPGPGGVCELGGHGRGVHGAADREDHRAGDPVRAVRARRRSSPPPTKPTCGPPPPPSAPPGRRSRCGCSTPSASPTSRKPGGGTRLHALATVEDAHRLAGHFVLTVADEHRRDLWGPAAQDLLAALFLAAATSGHTLHDVAGWLSEPAVPTPIELLTDAGFTAMAVSLRGAQNGAAETRDGIYQTARTAAKAMTDPEIMAWVDPAPPRHPAHVRPGRVRRRHGHLVSAVEVPLGCSAADRRAVRHRDARSGTPGRAPGRAAGPADGRRAG